MTTIKYFAIILSFLGTINSAFAADIEGTDDTPKKEGKTIKQVIKEEEKKRKNIIPTGFKESYSPKISHSDLTSMLAGAIGTKRLNQEGFEIPYVYVHEKVFPTKSTIYKYYSPTLDDIKKIEISDIISFKYSHKLCTSSGTNIATLCYFLITPKPEKDIKVQRSHAFIIAYYYKKDWLDLKEAEKSAVKFSINETLLGWALVYGKKISSAKSISSQQDKSKLDRRRSRSISGMDSFQLLAIQEAQAFAVKMPSSPQNKSAEPADSTTSSEKKADTSEKTPISETLKQDTRESSLSIGDEDISQPDTDPKVLISSPKPTEVPVSSGASPVKRGISYSKSPTTNVIPPLSLTQTPSTPPMSIPGKKPPFTRTKSHHQGVTIYESNPFKDLLHKRSGTPDYSPNHSYEFKSELSEKLKTRNSGNASSSSNSPSNSNSSSFGSDEEKSPPKKRQQKNN